MNYKEEIIKLLEEIDRQDILEYIYFFIKEKFKVG